LAVKARVFTLITKIKRNYKRSVKRAAKKIVDEGNADRFLSSDSDEENALKVIHE